MEESKKTLKGNINNSVRDRINQAKYTNGRLHLEDTSLTLEQLRLFAPTIKNIKEVRLNISLSSTDKKIAIPASIGPHIISLTLSGFYNNLNLDLFSSLINLKSLILRDGITLTTLDGLRNFEQLTHLEILNGTGLTGVKDLTHCPLLRELTINYASELKDFNPINSCVNLVILNLSYTNNKNLTFLTNCVNINTLSLINCDLVNSLVGLENCIALENITFSGLPCLDDISSLAYCINIRELFIHDCEILEDVTGLAGIVELDYLQLSKCPRLSNLTPLASCFKLTKIDMHTCPSIMDVYFLSKCPNLEIISFMNCSSLSNLDGIQSCKKLKRLIITNCTILDLSPLSLCTSLTVLRYNKNSLQNLDTLTSTSLQELYLDESKIVSLVGLDKCPNLNVLSLVQCDELMDISSVGSCLNLISLTINGCINLASLSGVQNCLALKDLSANDCIGLKSLKELSTCINLRRLDINRSSFIYDITALTNCRKLIYLDISYCRLITSVRELSFIPDLFIEGCGTLIM